jgi:hypothetical protein
VTRLFLIRVQRLLERNAEFLTQRLKLLEVLCVLALVLDLEFDAYDVLVVNIHRVIARRKGMPIVSFSHLHAKLGCANTHMALIGRTLKDSDSRGEVVDTPSGANSGSDDRRRGYKIVGEAVVQVSL